VGTNTGGQECTNWAQYRGTRILITMCGLLQEVRDCMKNVTMKVSGRRGGMC
jgi:hypothetical protein